MSDCKESTQHHDNNSKGKEKKLESPFVSFKRRTTHQINDDYPILDSFKEIKKENLSSDVWNELENQTAPFEHIFKSSQKAQIALPESLYNTDTQKGKFIVHPPQLLLNISSSSLYRFLSQIPKPRKDYLIRYDKYPDMPSRVPKI